jgi:DNA (cytosine-5)-methyltransferase 1
VVAAFLTRHFTGVVGRDLREPIPTVTGIDHNSLTTVYLSRADDDGAIRCAAFLMRYFGSGGQWSDLRDPVPTVTARENLALVTTTIAGERWVLTDIGMRMLTPRELARAQGFPDDYQLTGNLGEQIERIGNSVAPRMAEVIARANLPELSTPGVPHV